MFEDQEEERLEAIPAESSGDALEPQISATNFSRLLQVAGSNGRILPPRPYGSIIDIGDLRRKVYKENYFFCGASSSTPPERLHIKPAGKYAVLGHIGPEEEQLRCLQRLLNEIESKGLKIAGHCYGYDMMSTELHDITAQVMAGRYCIQLQ